MPKRTFSLEAPDQARLKIARAEIEAILKKHDLGGCCVLHKPGMAEWFYDISPSYSCAWIDEQLGAVRVKSKLADYGGDVEAQRLGQAATANLINAIGDQCAHAGLMFLQVAAIVDKACGAEHTAGALIPDALEGKLQ